MPINSNHRNISLASQQKQEERETWHKLVVKVICWKDGLVKDKITPREWTTYCQSMIKTNVSQGKQKVTENLKELQRIIKDHNGFA